MRRITIALVFLLLLGAIVNIAVAWGLGCFAKYQTSAASYEAMTTDPIRLDPVSGDRIGPPGISILRYSSFGAERVVITWTPWTMVDDPVHRPAIEQVWPRWGPLSRITPREVFDSTPAHQLGYAARGWPMLSMWCEFEHGHGRPRGGIFLHISHTPGTFITTEHILPLRPSCRGFAINTIIYAAALWLVFVAAPMGARRTVRRRRGACIHCGYDLRGHPAPAMSARCPECGAAMTRNRWANSINAGTK